MTTSKNNDVTTGPVHARKVYISLVESKLSCANFELSFLQQTVRRDKGYHILDGAKPPHN